MKRGLSVPPNATQNLIEASLRLAAMRAEAKAAGKSAAIYYNDLVGFARECIDHGEGEGARKYQDEIMQALIDHHRVAVVGPRELGKSWIAANAIAWFSITRDVMGKDWKVITTASAWNQLKAYLWPEVHKWARRVKWDVVGREPFRSGIEILTTGLRLKNGEASAISPEKPELIEGAHASEILYIFDEAKMIKAANFDAVEGSFGGHANAYALVISTPGAQAGRFWDIHSKKPGYEDWHTIQITVNDVIDAGVKTEEWVEQRRRQWGEDSAMFKNHVLGQFANDDPDALIPLAWIEAAHDRYLMWDKAGKPGKDKYRLRTLGADVGEDRDKSVVTEQYAQVYVDDVALRPFEIYELPKGKTMETAGRVAHALANSSAVAYVDAIGIGAGVADRLREISQQNNSAWRVIPFKGSNATASLDRAGAYGFANHRSKALYTLREMLDPEYGDNLALPPNDYLTGDLTALRWKPTSDGKIRVESTDSIRQRIGRSIDFASALSMALANEQAEKAAFTIQVPRTSVRRLPAYARR